MKRVFIQSSLWIVACAAVPAVMAAPASRSPRTAPVEVSFAASNLCQVALAVVDGRPLTAAAVKDAVMITGRTMELASGRKRPPLSGRRANLLAMRLTPQIVSSMILEQELEKRGIKATKESDAALLLVYSRKVKKNVKSLDQLAALYGDLADEFKIQFSKESRFRSFFSAEKNLAVTDEDVTKYYADLTNRMARSARINLRATNTLEKAWASLKAGASWETVATNCTEDALLDPSLADNWKEWMSLELNKLEPSNLQEAVSKLKPGEYTRPIETDEGLVIVKLLSQEGNFVSLARILVRLGAVVEIPDRETALKKIAREKNRSFQMDLLSSLRKKAKIEYPYGRRFKFKIWEEEQPSGKKQRRR
jgi:hypothetical protein